MRVLRVDEKQPLRNEECDAGVMRAGTAGAELRLRRTAAETAMEEGKRPRGKYTGHGTKACKEGIAAREIRIRPRPHWCSADAKCKCVDRDRMDRADIEHKPVTEAAPYSTNFFEVTAHTL